MFEEVESVENLIKIISNMTIKKLRENGVNFSDAKEKVLEALDLIDKTVMAELFNVYSGDGENNG